MRLEGSCACGAVKFTVETPAPMPYCRCYCPDCRKTSGGGGFTAWMIALAETLEVEGKENLALYAHECPDGRASEEGGGRRFCKHCGSHLWFFDPRWPRDLHPFASVIDTPLPVPAKTVDYYTAHKASWVPLPEGGAHEICEEAYTVGMIDWHRQNGFYEG